MSKKKSIVVGSVSAGALVASVMLLQEFENVHIVKAMYEETEEQKVVVREDVQEETKEVEEEEIGSIALSPGMYIPDADLFLNQPVTQEDVDKTLAIEIVRIATNAALAELSQGIEFHLGYPAEELTQNQIDLYEENVSYYSKNVIELQDTASSEQEVLDVIIRFRVWSSDYKAAITADKNAKEVKEVEIVDESAEESVDTSEHISFGIPALDDQYLTYMPYTAITAKTTPHYRLQQLATTNAEGYRVYDDAICIALGSAYGTTIGTLYNIKFADGKEMRAVLSDNKSDRHTDKLHQYRDATGTYDGSSGNIVEIVFDTKNYEDMYAVNKKINSDYAGKVVSITKVGMAKGFGQ